MLRDIFFILESCCQKKQIFFFVALKKKKLFCFLLAKNPTHASRVSNDILNEKILLKS